MNVSDNGHGLKSLNAPIVTEPPLNFPHVIPTGTTGLVSGTQTLGGCEWGFKGCQNHADKNHASDSLAYAVLDISHNRTEGEIPATMGDIPFLRILDLGNNAFSGTLPEELGNLIYLDSLVIGNNDFSGLMPQSFTNLTNLTYFNFGDSGLEVPTDPAFQDWLAGIPDVVSTAIEFAEGEDPGRAYGLSAVYPNPFRQVAQFTLRLETPQQVQIAVYNLLGQRIAVLHEGRLASHEAHAFALDGSALASGLYLITVQGETFSTTGKAIVVR